MVCKVARQGLARIVEALNENGWTDRQIATFLTDEAKIPISHMSVYNHTRGKCSCPPGGPQTDISMMDLEDLKGEDLDMATLKPKVEKALMTALTQGDALNAERWSKILGMFDERGGRYIDIIDQDLNPMIYSFLRERELLKEFGLYLEEKGITREKAKKRSYSASNSKTQIEDQDQGEGEKGVEAPVEDVVQDVGDIDIVEESEGEGESVEDIEIVEEPDPEPEESGEEPYSPIDPNDFSTRKPPKEEKERPKRRWSW